VKPTGKPSSPVQGLSDHFSFALHGPAEQIIPFLQNLKGKSGGNAMDFFIWMRAEKSHQQGATLEPGFPGKGPMEESLSPGQNRN
jgi:hypothetical protein